MKIGDRFTWRNDYKYKGKWHRRDPPQEAEVIGFDTNLKHEGSWVEYDVVELRIWEGDKVVKEDKYNLEKMEKKYGR